ncbi:VOC family protein [Chryseobacterium sp.]|uniref:VOC family protein n=1 Tax=Chryseobacterium sp. TaxID=1871047 RepID=UPI0025BC6ED5|nr:VOC family protein [Chryseobacterium sp.]
MKVNTLIPNLAVVDIRQTVQFYRENLGFKLVMAVPETQDCIDQQLHSDKIYVYAMLNKDNTSLMLQRIDTIKEDISIFDKNVIGASVSLYLQGIGIDKFYNELKSKKIQITEMRFTWYGIKEFYIKDNNGYILGFAEEMEKSES